MRTVPTVPSICPDCKTIVPARSERCQACGRLMDWMKGSTAKPWYTRWWAITLAVLAVMWAVGVVTGPAQSPRLTVGSMAVVRHEGAKGAWFAVDDEAFDSMIDGQISQKPELLDYLAEKGRIFREPNGSRVLVLKAGFESAFVQVRKGVNVGSEGWVQSPLLAPDH
jgi:hypothetical protein